MNLENIKRIYSIVPPVKFFLYLSKHQNNNISRNPTIDFSFSMHSTEPLLKFRVNDKIYEEPLPCGMARMPAREYEIKDHGKRDILVFCYDAKYLPFFQEHNISPELPIWHYSATPIIQKTIPEILELSAHIAEPGNADQLDLLALSLLTQTRTCRENHENDEFHKIIIKKIESQMISCSKSIHSLNEMIKNSGISRRTFYRYWKMYHQESPHEFMRNCFLSNAGQMLLETSLSVNEIANAMGFQNTSHFFVLFKKYVGMSPLQFRKSAAKDIPHIPYDKI